jgi:ribosomal protein L44E
MVLGPSALYKATADAIVAGCSGYTRAERTMAGSTKPTFSDPDAWWGQNAGPLPTPRTILTAERLRLAVSCDRCGHERDADLQALIDGGHGDVSWNRLRFRCSVCGSRRTTVEIRGARPSQGTAAR